jgi:hypothetical protein
MVQATLVDGEEAQEANSKPAVWGQEVELRE